MKKQTKFNSVGAYLRKLRKSCKLTIKEAAENAKISSSFLSQIETGVRGTPRHQVLMDLSYAYQVNLQDFIEIKEQNFFESKKEHDKYLHLVFNPPYDERLSVKNIEEFYGNIGNTLKHGYPGSQAWMITSNMDALKCVGLRPSQKIKLFNGKLEAKLVKYEMYSGSKKASKQ